MTVRRKLPLVALRRELVGGYEMTNVLALRKFVVRMCLPLVVEALQFPFVGFPPVKS